LEHVIVAALVLLTAVVLSGWLARALGSRVPLPLIQIGLGSLLAATTELGLRLEPEIFFLFFLPPLLFLDGWRIPKDRLFGDLRVIVSLALGLVVFTVVGVGYLIHWMIPPMPLPVAFALASALAPTDPVAVGAMLERSRLPPRMINIIRGESLLNDASGLVCMRFAVIAATTGTFSLVDAGATFLWLAGAGIAAGVATTWAATKVQDLVAVRAGEESGSKILLSLLLPFGAYLLAERLGASGILAAVSAGITMAFAEQTGRALPTTRVRRAAVWDMLQFALNGAMFVLLGEQLPLIVAGASTYLREAETSPGLIVVHILVVAVSLIVLRYFWLHVSYRLRVRRRWRPGRNVNRLLLVGAFAGVRGSITLAGILTLPLTIGTSAFPARDLAIVIAAGVVIVSIAIAGVVLPRLLKGIVLPPEDEYERFERRARKAAALAAIDAVESASHEEHSISSNTVSWMEAAARVSADYRARIDGIARTGEDAEDLRRAETIDRSLRLAGLRAERQTYFRLGRERKLSDEIVRRLVAEVDQLETRLS
jgi:Na+/H+ antiporter